MSLWVNNYTVNYYQLLFFIVCCSHMEVICTISARLLWAERGNNQHWMPAVHNAATTHQMFQNSYTKREAKRKITWASCDTISMRVLKRWWGFWYIFNTPPQNPNHLLSHKCLTPPCDYFLNWEKYLAQHSLQGLGNPVKPSQTTLLYIIYTLL